MKFFGNLAEKNLRKFLRMNSEYRLGLVFCKNKVQEFKQRIRFRKVKVARVNLQHFKAFLKPS